MTARHSTRQAGLVYFIQSESSRLIKIGFTRRCPLRRLANLSTQGAQVLRLLGVIPEGRTLTERSLHARFRRLRFKGEWFAPERELLDFIADQSVAYSPDMVRRGKPSTPRDVATLRVELAFEAAHRRGWGRERIRSDLGISRATYYRILGDMTQSKGTWATGVSPLHTSEAAS